MCTCVVLLQVHEGPPGDGLLQVQVQLGRAAQPSSRLWFNPSPSNTSLIAMATGTCCHHGNKHLPAPWQQAPASTMATRTMVIGPIATGAMAIQAIQSWRTNENFETLLFLSVCVLLIHQCFVSWAKLTKSLKTFFYFRLLGHLESKIVFWTLH